MPHRTPLFDWHKALGGRMVDFAGWEMPIQYTSIVDEHEAVRREAGIFDISHMGRLVFQGPGALNFIQKIYTNNAATMKPGQVRYGLICNEKGGIRDDVLVYRLDPDWLMVVNASNREKILAWIEENRGSHDFKLTDKTFDWGMVAIQGPMAVKLVEQHSEAAVALKYYFARHDGAGDDYCIWSRTGYTGEDGWEAIVPKNRLLDLVESLIGPASQKAGVALKPCGLGARDTLRLEAAMPLYGHELSEEIDPFQAGLGWAVKMDKGDFIGRDSLARRKADPTLPRRIGMELEGKRIAREGCEIRHDDKTIGHVTSGTFAPTLGKSIAMGYVAPECTEIGTKLEVDIRGKTAGAQVVPLPFYQRRKL
ncbi:MAG: aminomethyltransferase [Gemmatales bacterium]|nr:MAG: aminomethyltransferase [Gemmatales bacterium]